ncbi:uncharacterized protein PHALS_08239 [Plasmopara halstedii]|uniref:Uncharacterized protein n=1 Tax=Plasmopara halstedii TaxID=4781 RepID=A0A0P1ABB5_PLAHL|nr:uncharacterized protein PHALS_08239 [Plasmopara halstedii]CEG38150.1 hypothetical protein PHALS_08239 [Plasmopara halstedii]|eukprot:XP_024574519.1 hypothetical protein PHALS_08239 [Plasmopara halstedii]
MWVDADPQYLLRQSTRPGRMHWANMLLVCLIAAILCTLYLACFQYRRCCCQEEHRREMARVPSATSMISDMEEPLLKASDFNEQSLTIESDSVALYQPSAPPFSLDI